MQEILQKNNPLLRQTARLVTLVEISRSPVKNVIKKMKLCLDREEDGLALAAPQIGVPLRIFIVSGKLFPGEKGQKTENLVFINPEIRKMSKKKKTLEEGCLSVRWLYGLVPRAEKATVSAYDEQAKKFTYNASGLLAQIFQHEIDHLNGVLFIDKARKMEEIKPKNDEKNKTT